MHLDVVPTEALDAQTRDEILALCVAAYDEDIAAILDDIGPGTHFLLRSAGVIVSHAMLVTRSLIIEHQRPLSTAYVELVATLPSHQHRGFATMVLRELVPHIALFDIGALSPSDPAFYARLGWELWYGPLSTRTASGSVPTPGDEVMILRVPQTPTNLDTYAPISVEWRPGDVW